MKTYRIQNVVAKGKEIFVGLEDSKRTWKLAVRSEKMVIHQVSMEANYSVLIGYLRNKFPECTIHVMYEAGFKVLTSTTSSPRTAWTAWSSHPTS